MIRQMNVQTGVETQREPTQVEKDALVIAVAAKLANAPYREIARLELQETPRRLAESVLSDEGKAWLTSNRQKIAIERAKP
jgi:hypothetical protein